MATNRRNWKPVWFVIAMLLLIFIGYLPAICYWGYRFGVWNGAIAPQVLPAELTLRKGWYPVASSNTWLGDLILSRDLPSSVLYKEVDYVAPWSGRQLLVSRFRLPAGTEIGSVTSEVKKLDWADVYVVRPEITRANSLRLAVEPVSGLGFMYVDPRSLLAIRKVGR